MGQFIDAIHDHERCGERLLKDNGEIACSACGLPPGHVPEDEVLPIVQKDEFQNALEEFVAWLDDSLNGVRGEVEELKAGQDREDVVEHLEWKTENMMEEARDVAEEITEDSLSKRS